MPTNTHDARPDPDATDGFTIRGKTTSAFVTIDHLDGATLAQVQRMASHPSATNPIAIMPDAHAGKGCCVGFTMRAGATIVPNWIGVDIGCGMRAVDTGIPATRFSDNVLAAVDRGIRAVVPLGMAVNEGKDLRPRAVLERLVRRIRQRAVDGTIGDGSAMAHARPFAEVDTDGVSAFAAGVGARSERFIGALGSLGGGNHFVEMGVASDTGNAWLVIHTGSRNFGKCVCEHHDRIAQKRLTEAKPDPALAARLKAEADAGRIERSDIGRLLAEHRKARMPAIDVRQEAYLEGADRDAYLSGMFVAQTYAEVNRTLITDRILEVIGDVVAARVEPADTVETVHNYLGFHDGVMRKGAVSAHEGERIIVPFNMRDGILLCRGKGNPAWNQSAPHGAGRVLSRSQAKQQVDMADFTASMAGIFSTSVSPDTLDESPMAYKDAAMIERAIAPTADILFRLKPIYNLKAGGS